MSQWQTGLRKLISGVAHIGYVVEDMAAALARFEKLYGITSADIRLEPASDEEAAATRFAFFSVGGLEFEVIQPVSEHFRELLMGQPSGGGGINHVAWQVSDMAAAMSALAARGIGPGYVTPDGPVKFGNKTLVYLDPGDTDGVMVELIEIHQ